MESQFLLMRLSFAQWFKLKREAADLSQADVAARLGVKPQTISNWEKERSTPSLDPDQMLALCSLLEVDLNSMAKAFRGELEVND